MNLGDPPLDLTPPNSGRDLEGSRGTSPEQRTGSVLIRNLPSYLTTAGHHAASVKGARDVQRLDGVCPGPMPGRQGIERGASQFRRRGVGCHGSLAQRAPDLLLPRGGRHEAELASREALVSCSATHSSLAARSVMHSANVRETRPAGRTRHTFSAFSGDAPGEGCGVEGGRAVRARITLCRLIRLIHVPENL